MSYLEKIFNTWKGIVGEDEKLMKLIDGETIEALELRAPSVSRDRLYLRGLFEEGMLFKAITDRELREGIWKNLITVRGLIPTLHTFFEDIKFLGPSVKAMKGLLGRSFKGTIDSALHDHFSHTSQPEGLFRLQRSETKLSLIQGSITDQVQFGNFTLWLFAMRYCFEMTGECPRKDRGGNTPAAKEPNDAVWYSFAVLALELGYSSDRIRELASVYPSKRFIPARVEIDSEIRPPLTSDESDESLQRRCGRVFDSAHASDRPFLYLEMLYEPEQGDGKGITSLYVRQSVIFAFFKRPIPSQYNKPEQTASDNLINPFRALIDQGDPGSVYELGKIAALSEVEVDPAAARMKQDAVAQEIRNLNSELEDAVQAKLLAQKENSDLREDNNRLQASEHECGILHNRLQQSIADCSRFQAEAFNLQNKQAEAKVEISSLQAQNHNLNVQAEEVLSQERGKLSVQQDKFNKERSELIEQGNSLRDQLSQAQQQLTDQIQSRFNTESKELNNIRTERDDLKSKLQDYKSQAKKENENLKKQLTTLQNELSQLKLEIQEKDTAALNASKVKAQELKKIQMERDNLESKLQDQENLVEKAIYLKTWEENEDLKKQFTTLQNELSQLKLGIQEKEIVALNKPKSKAQEELRYEQLQSSYDLVSKQLKNERLERDNLILKQQELEKQVEDLRAEQQKTNDENATLKEEFNATSSAVWAQLQAKNVECDNIEKLLTAERARKTELEGLNSRLTQDVQLGNHQPYCPSPEEGCNEGVELSTVSRIKEAPTNLNPLLASAPPDTSSPFAPTDPVPSLLKPEFTGPHTQEPTPTNIQSSLSAPTPDQPQAAAPPAITNPNISSLLLGPTSTSQLSQHTQLQEPAPNDTQSPLLAPTLSTLGPREKRKRERYEGVEINKGRGNADWAPNPKRARLGEGELNQKNLTDGGQASEECKLEESKEVNINK